MKKYVRCADGLDSVNEFAVDKLLRKKPLSVTNGPRRYVWAVFFNAGYNDIPLFVDPGAYGYNCKLTWVNDKEKFESDSAELKEAAEELGIPLSAHWGVGKPYVTIPYHRRHDASGYDEAKDEDAIREKEERSERLSRLQDELSIEELEKLSGKDLKAVLLRGYNEVLSKFRKQFKGQMVIKPEPAGIHTSPKIWDTSNGYKINIELYFIPDRDTDFDDCVFVAQEFVEALKNQYSGYELSVSSVGHPEQWTIDGLKRYLKTDRDDMALLEADILIVE